MRTGGGPLDDPYTNGIILLDKPMGPSSHQASAWVRDIFGIDKAGHGGTLDPRVTGVLVVMLGNATRGAGALNYGEKEYIGVIRFHRDVDIDTVSETVELFTGRIYQTPPVRSAVARRLRQRTIHELEFIEMDGRDALIRARCESGTYIRTLARDMGRAIGTGAHLQELRRTRSCTFTIDECVTLQDVKDAHHFWKEEGDSTEMDRIVQPFERLFDHLPAIVVKDSAVDALCHGAPLMAPGVRSASGEIRKGSMVSVKTTKGEVVGLAKTVLDVKTMVEEEKGFAAKMTRVFMDPGTYHRVWKVKG